ncbi:MAG: SIR2 family protein [Chloroflexi bacterium]|nr:SIR2 family protein [Chloroflexota bacterium]
METIPRELLTEVKSGNCVPFLGAGISTEAPFFKEHYGENFYDYIKRLSKQRSRSRHLSFPDMMQYFCDKVDGGRKNRLIREIIDWIEPFCFEGGNKRLMTIFHKEIARVPYFKIFVTTNWDIFCERALNVLVPMVEDRDIPFWDDSKRQILKIHGCITRPHTIIATREDYEKCLTDRKNTALFTKLRDLMATKTFIFFGYSMSDPDFEIIYDEVINNLGEFRRSSYVVDPTPNERTVIQWDKRGVKAVKMYGIAFLKEIIRDLENNKIIPTEELITYFDLQRELIVEIHGKTCEKQNTDFGFISSMYQDGLLHALEHVLYKSQIGSDFNEFKKELDEEFLPLLNRYIKRRNSTEIAYYTGWVEVLNRLINQNRRVLLPFLNPRTLRPTKFKKGLMNR